MKNIGIGIAAVGLIIATWVFGNAIKNRNSSDNTISVTGLGTKSFTSDLITWEASYSEDDMHLQKAYDKLARDRKVITDYFTQKGVKMDELVFSAVNIQKQYAQERTPQGYYVNGAFIGYNLSQTVSIKSKEVEKIEKISRTVTEIINKGVQLTSSSPQYYYTKLADLKHELIANGTKDARERAEKIAENAGAQLGSLKEASMGVIQIVAPYSNEDYSWGGTFNTTSKEKVARITIRLKYHID